MTRIDEIILKKDAESDITLETIQTSLERYLKFVASATKFSVVTDSSKVMAVISRSVSLFRVNKILNYFSKEGFEIEEFTWKRMHSDKDWKGCLEIILS